MTFGELIQVVWDSLPESDKDLFGVMLNGLVWDWDLSEIPMTDWTDDE